MVLLYLFDSIYDPSLTLFHAFLLKSLPSVIHEKDIKFLKAFSNVFKITNYLLTTVT